MFLLNFLPHFCCIFQNAYGIIDTNMGPSQNDFVNQFEQQVSGPNSSKGGDIILTSDKPSGKSKKPIIIAAVAVVVLLGIVAIFMLKSGNGGNSGNFNALAKDYAMSAAYGLDYNKYTDEERKELVAEEYYYLLDYEKVDSTYLESLEKKLADLEGAAANKTSVHNQLENIKFYRIAKLFLDGSTDYEYLVPENVSNSLKSAYSVLARYKTTKESMEQGVSDYADGIISEDELINYEADYSRANSSLVDECREIRENAATYARSLYEEK